jgi:hypothetical protein
MLDCLIPTARLCGTLLVAGFIVVVAQGCGFGGGSDGSGTPTPPAIQTATAQAEKIVFDGDVAGEGWSELPELPAMRPAPVGGFELLDRLFESWATCVGGYLSGGFVGLGRAGVASSARYSDGQGRIVAGAAAIFTLESGADEALRVLEQTDSECGKLGEPYRVLVEQVPAAPPEVALSYRLRVTLETRRETFSSTFDLVVVRTDFVLSALIFKDFGTVDDGQAEMVGRAIERLR